MTLQSSFKRQLDRLPTRYWVLPCCLFSFWGKFQREKFNSANSSRYFEYLRFVELLGKLDGTAGIKWKKTGCESLPQDGHVL